MTRRRRSAPKPPRQGKEKPQRCDNCGKPAFWRHGSGARLCDDCIDDNTVTERVAVDVLRASENTR